MDAFVMTAFGLALVALAYAIWTRLTAANDRLRDALGRAEAQAESLRRINEVLKEAGREQSETVRVLRRKLAKARNELATRSQQSSQEMQPQASSGLPEVVALLPTAASRLANYVKEQAAMNGQALSDYEAEQAAASMLVESGI